MYLRPIICTIAAALAAAICAPLAAANHETFAAGSDPDWSPDGRQLVYVRSLGDGADLWLMDARGRNKRPLLRTPGAESDPSWSPDGKRIAYSGRTQSGRHLFVVDVATRKVTQVTSGSGSDYGSDWSPDGTQLVFSRYLDSLERSQLFLIDADGSNVRPLVVDEGDDVDPRFAPDGRFVLFVGGPEEEGYIEVVEVANHAHRRLTDSGEDYSAAWTADGRILFARETDDEDLWIMDSDGTSQRRLLGFGDSDEWGPASSPDGRWIAYVSDRDDAAQIFLARADGNGTRRLTGTRYVESVSGSRCTIWGTPGADVLRGTRGEDVICGLGGNDVVIGLGASDTLDGGGGDDRLVGGEGRDWFYGGAGNDVFESRDGERESIDGGTGYDRAHADAGDWLSFVEAWL